MTTTKKPQRGSTRSSAPSHRMNVRVPTKLAKAVREEAVHRRVSEASIVAATLADRYDPERADQRDRLLTGELRSIRRELQRVQFQQRATAEVLAVAIKNIVAMLPAPTAEGHKRAASFYNFLASEAEKALAGDRALVDQLAEKILTFGEEDFASVEPATGSHPADHDALTFEDKDS